MQRYDLDLSGDMMPSPDGDFVSFDDAMTIIDDLRDTIAHLNGEIDDLYRQAAYNSD